MAFRSTFIPVPPRKPITKLPRIFSGSCTIRANLLKKPPNNITMKRPAIPGRPLYYRYLSALRQRKCLWRPVRKMRYLAECHRSDQSEIDAQRQHPVLRDTQHWFLPLDKYEPFLKKWILEENKDWKTNVYGQCKSWLDHGLQPRAVTRDLDWGIPVPVEGAKGKVLYVWFDAPIGYISATRDPDSTIGKNTGRIRKPTSSISSARTISFFIALFFPLCSKPKAPIFCPKMFLPMNS